MSHECRHCGYAVPSDLSRCPGCSRRYRRTRPVTRRGEEWDLQGLWPNPPPRPAGQPRPDRPAQHAHYRSLLGVAVPLRLLLWVTGWGALSLAAVRGARFVLTFTSKPWPSGRPEAVWTAMATWSRGIAAAELFAIVVTGLAFMAWALRAYENLPGLGIEDRRYWTAWAILGWIVPGANLFVPKLLIDDVWRGSSPSLPARPTVTAWQRRPVGDVVHLWWTLWLVTPALAVVVTTLVANAPVTLSQTRLWEGAATLSGIALAGAAAAARQMVGVITVAQAHRADLVGAMPAPATAAWSPAQIRPA